MSLSFNSRYAGKIHRSCNAKPRSIQGVSIPAMRVRYIITTQGDVRDGPLFQFPLCG